MDQDKEPRWKPQKASCEWDGHGRPQMDQTGVQMEEPQRNLRRTSLFRQRRPESSQVLQLQRLQAQMNVEVPEDGPVHQGD